MEKERIEKNIEKYRRKSSSLNYSAEKCYYFECLAEQIEDNLDIYLDDFYETEKDIVDDAKEFLEESDPSWMFDREEDFNDEDDGIGGFLSRED